MAELAGPARPFLVSGLTALHPALHQSSFADKADFTQAGFEPGMFGPGELSGRSNAQPGPSCDRLRKMFGVVRNGDQT